MQKTSISWTEKTWNPVTGCTPISRGCMNCYAAAMANRFRGRQGKYKNGFKVTLHEDSLDEPLHELKSCRIFVCSMGDSFHEDVSFEFVDKIMETIDRTPWHKYLILTKRPERMAEYFQTREVHQNAWLGTTVEAAEYKYRVDILRSIKGSFKFLSCEPLVENLGELDLTGVDWVIVGGESGSRARPMKEEWVMNIKDQAEVQGVAFFFKQWGTWGSDGVKRSKEANGHLLNGKVYQKIPDK